MLRSIIGNAFRAASQVTSSVTIRDPIRIPLQQAFYSSLQAHAKTTSFKFYSPVAINTGLLDTSSTSKGLLLQTVRDVTKFSLTKGKRRTVRAVLMRFKRLDWGMWIRTRAGRHRKLSKKSGPLRHRLRQHVFTNSQQSWMLDKMVCSYWRRPKNWVDDPYEPYHTRDEFFATKGKTFKV